MLLNQVFEWSSRHVTQSILGRCVLDEFNNQWPRVLRPVPRRSIGLRAEMASLVCLKANRQRRVGLPNGLGNTLAVPVEELSELA